MPTFPALSMVSVLALVWTRNADGKTDADIFKLVSPDPSPVKLPTKLDAVTVPFHTSSLDLGIADPIPTLLVASIVTTAICVLTLKAGGSLAFGSVPLDMFDADRLLKPAPSPV